MISMAIPGVGDFCWSHLVLDVNGTLTTDGALVPGVAQRLRALSSQVTVHLLTADTRGTVAELAKHLGVDCRRVERGREAEQKRAQVEALGADQVIAVGNGNNDAMMLSAASLGIAAAGGPGGDVSESTAGCGHRGTRRSGWAGRPPRLHPPSLYPALLKYVTMQTRVLDPTTRGNGRSWCDENLCAKQSPLPNAMR